MHPKNEKKAFKFSDSTEFRAEEKEKKIIGFNDGTDFHENGTVQRVQTGYHQPLKAVQKMDSIGEEDDALRGVDFGQETEFRDDQKQYRKTGFQIGQQKMDTYSDETAEKEVNYGNGLDFKEDTKVQRIQTGFAKPLTAAELAALDEDQAKKARFTGDDDDAHTNGHIQRIQTGYVHKPMRLSDLPTEGPDSQPLTSEGADSHLIATVNNSSEVRPVALASAMKVSHQYAEGENSKHVVLRSETGGRLSAHEKKSKSVDSED